jgi:hypothetical protein
MRLPRERWADRPRHRRARWQARIAVVSLLSTMLVAPLMVGTSSSANAQSACPAGLRWQPISLGDWGGVIGWSAPQTALVSSTPTFFVSEQRVADNTTSSDITATWSAGIQRTHTVTVTTTTGVQVGPPGGEESFLRFLNAQVSVAIVQSVTTSIGVSVTATVPPFSRRIGQYGVAGHNVTVDQIEWWSVPFTPQPPSGGEGSCSIFQSTRYNVSAPTAVEGWRIIPG